MSQSIVIYGCFPYWNLSAYGQGQWLVHFVSWDLAQVLAYNSHSVIIHQLNLLDSLNIPFPSSLYYLEVVELKIETVSQWWHFLISHCYEINFSWNHQNDIQSPKAKEWILKKNKAFDTFNSKTSEFVGTVRSA